MARRPTPDRTAIYLPAVPGDPRNRSLLVRSGGTSAAIIADLKRLCADVDGVYACDPVTLREISTRFRFPFEAARAVSSVLGVLALVMACIGLYGVVAFTVVQRTREVGIRLAVGATPSGVLRSILAQSMRRVGLGMILGTALCLAFSKIASSVLHLVKTFDLTAYVVIPLFLAAVTLLAAYLPARRAARISPTIALRQE